MEKQVLEFNLQKHVAKSLYCAYLCPCQVLGAIYDLSISCVGVETEIELGSVF